MAERAWSAVVRVFARLWEREPPPRREVGDDDDFDDPLLRAVAAAPAIPLRPPAAQWLPDEATPPKRRS